MKRSNTSSTSSQPRLMRSLPLIAVLAILIGLGCSDSARDSSDSTQRILLDQGPTPHILENHKLLDIALFLLDKR